MSRGTFVRPSAIGAIAACNGRPFMEDAVVSAFGEPSTSEIAEVGNAVDGFMGKGIEAWKAGAEWGDAIADACNQAAASGLNRYDVFCIQISIEFIRDLVAKHDAERDNVMTQHWLDMSAYGINRGGTCDVAIVIPFKLLIIVDEKAGYIDQGDASEHDQTMVYGVAGAETFKVPEVEVYLFQPRNEKSRRITGTKFNAVSLRKNAAWTSAIVRLAMAENPEIKPGYEQCKYCKALTRCAAAKEYFMLAREAAALIGKPTDPDAWGELVDAAKVAQRFYEEGTDAAKAWAKAGGEITGWGLKDSGTVCKIDAQKAIKLAREAGTFDRLLEFAAFGADAARSVPGIEEACAFIPKAKSLSPRKTATAAA